MLFEVLPIRIHRGEECLVRFLSGQSCRDVNRVIGTRLHHEGFISVLKNPLRFRVFRLEELRFAAIWVR